MKVDMFYTFLQWQGNNELVNRCMNDAPSYYHSFEPPMRGFSFDVPIYRRLEADTMSYMLTMRKLGSTIQS